MPPRKRKIEQVHPALQSRIKNFYRLANRYVQYTLTPGNVQLPNIFEFKYTTLDNEPVTEELVLYTNSLCMAVMLFEAVMLEQQILVTVLEAKFISQYIPK